MRYKGRKVYTLNGYPMVTWRSHPLADRSGRVYVHRDVAYDLYGEDIIGMDVHHKDGNRTNWRADNLEVLPHDEHSR